MIAPYTSAHTRQRGSALIVGIILLLVMTMLGLTAMQTTSMEERMAGNMRDRDLATQAAEMALRAGEVEALAVIGALTGNGAYTYDTNAAPDESLDANWVSSKTRAWADGAKMTSVAASVGMPSLFEAPAYWIEQQPNIRSTTDLTAGKANDVAVFDITARSRGASGTSTVILRSTVMQ
ncbi:MAG: hypothetical protein FHP94_18015 [Denitromonas halophila]|nr:MAG: hypothetical protein FHP94_18015 [Denitromonas halophila]TVT71893.1 MAG: hypothetical protein FHP93_08845 [Denitromonas halophila]